MGSGAHEPKMTIYEPSVAAAGSGTRERIAGFVPFEQNPQDEGPSVTLASLLPSLRRSIWLIALTVLMTTLAGAIYVITTPSGYIAMTEILIEPHRQQLGFADPGVLDLTVDTAEVESQVQILKSERVAGGVVDALRLVEDPDFQDKNATSNFLERRVAIARFAAGLSARRIGESDVIEVSFQSSDPEKSERIVNSTADFYMQDQLEAKRDAARRAGQWMQDRIMELGAQLNAAAVAVQKFKRDNGISDAAGRGNQTLIINQLTELEARAEAYRKLYESFVEKLTENEEAESFPVINARVIAAAARPLTRSYPKTKMVMMFAILLGLLIGVGVAFVRHVLDHTVRSARTVRQALGLTCLGSLPLYQRAPGSPSAPGVYETIDAPFSKFTMAVRNIKVSIDVARRTLPERRIGIVSLLPSEGKTTLCNSLAIMFTMSGSKTLLIDGDFEHQAISRTWAPAAKLGLIEALEADENDAIWLDHRTNMRVLPVVNSGQVPNSSDVLGSGVMERLLGRLDKSFDTILIDLPALTAVPDARAIGPLLDACIIVVEWGRTPIDALREAVDVLRMGSVPLLGVVINKVEDGVPPLFGIGLGTLRDIDWIGHADGLVGRAAQITSQLVGRAAQMTSRLAGQAAQVTSRLAGRAAQVTSRLAGRAAQLTSRLTSRFSSR
jgi:capsular exopolysaccharide synthesis family protein